MSPKLNKKIVGIDAHDAMEQIQALMDRKEWDADTLDAIADVMRSAGYPIRDVEEGQS